MACILKEWLSTVICPVCLSLSCPICLPCRHRHLVKGGEEMQGPEQAREGRVGHLDSLISWVLLCQQTLSSFLHT
ncbi:hypothetical protein F5H01DRAFT_180240 [Linnemannia elongata]|nr:hypothetical protein F5H01DRAFT_180240 [Linnemannia elongata]